jgi:hypothetical protein
LNYFGAEFNPHKLRSGASIKIGDCTFWSKTPKVPVVPINFSYSDLLVQFSLWYSAEKYKTKNYKISLRELSANCIFTLKKLVYFLAIVRKSFVLFCLMYERVLYIFVQFPKVCWGFKFTTQLLL